MFWIGLGIALAGLCIGVGLEGIADAMRDKEVDNERVLRQQSGL